MIKSDRPGAVIRILFRTTACSLLVGLGLIAVYRPAVAQAAPPQAKSKQRTLFVPFNDLAVILGGENERVFLERTEFDRLRKLAKKNPVERAPRAAWLTHADYRVAINGSIADILADVKVEVLEPGWHTVPLKISGVQLQQALFDDQTALLGRSGDGSVLLFVHGIGTHSLKMKMRSDVVTSAAIQTMGFQLPDAGSRTLELDVPGNVDVKSGGDVIARTYRETENRTQFSLLPKRGPVMLAVSLNNVQLRKERLVIARSVLVSEVTASDERLYATVSMEVLHGAADGFLLEIPAGFQITSASSARMTQWAIRKDGDRQLLDFDLREAIQGTEVIQITATRTPARLSNWTMPKVVPQNVAGHVAVIGLLAEVRLKPIQLQTSRLIPLDHEILMGALPADMAKPQPGAPPIRPLAVFYAPTEDYQWSAELQKPPVKLQSTIHLLLQLRERQQELRGGFTLTPQGDRLKRFGFRLPDGWVLNSLLDEQNKPIPFERFVQGEAQRFVARFPVAIPIGGSKSVFFSATRVSSDWYGEWDQRVVVFPDVQIENSTPESGAIAVAAMEDWQVVPVTLDGLRPLDTSQRAEFGLVEQDGDLAYAVAADAYRGEFQISKKIPRLNSRNYSFFQVKDGVLTAHYEVIVDISRARTRFLELALPVTTPATLVIRGIDDVQIDESIPTVTEDRRVWTVRLSNRRRGIVKLAVDFEIPLTVEAEQTIKLPLIDVVDAVYQTNVVSVEGDPALEVTTNTKMRSVDVGEVASASYLPGKRLLGVFASTPNARNVDVVVRRRSLMSLPPAIVQRAELVTLVSSSGIAQTAARYSLRTKVPLLAIKLPNEAKLWSATVDGAPVQPRRRKAQLLLSLKAAQPGAVRDVKIVFESPINAIRRYGSLGLDAPQLWTVADEEDQGVSVPQADLVWHLHLPLGYEITSNRGDVFCTERVRPRLPLTSVLKSLYVFGGGIALRPSAMTGVSMMYNTEDVTVDFEMAQAEMPYGSAFERDMDDKTAENETNAPGSPPAGGMSGQKSGNAAPAPPPTNDSKSAGESGPTAGRDPTSLSPELLSRKANAKLRYWAFQGLRGVTIELSDQNEGVEFTSLGDSPSLDVTLVNTRQIGWLAFAAAFLILAFGITLSQKSVYQRLRFVAVVWVVTFLLSTVGGPMLSLMNVCAMACIAATLLLPIWVFIGGATLFARVANWAVRGRSSSSVTAGLLGLLFCGFVTPGYAQQNLAEVVEKLQEPLPPLVIPKDAIVVPYDPEDPAGRANADKVMVPYDLYVRLWNLAYPDQKIGPPKLPATFALAGAVYESALSENDDIEIRGKLDFEVFGDPPVDVPLGLSGAVITSATLDGQPAVIQAVEVSIPKPQQQKGRQQVQTPQPKKSSLVFVRVYGKGRHRLEFSLRVPVQRQGGWRQIAAVIPHAPASSMTVSVPQEGTQLRYSLADARTRFQTVKPDDRVVWGLKTNGKFDIAWRAKIAPGSVDRSLTGQSTAVVDIVADGIKVAWRTHLQFGQDERSGFQFLLPDGYNVERVAGKNVRSWKMNQDDGKQILEVELLKAVKEKETLDVFLMKRQLLASPTVHQAAVPYLTILDAALHRGIVALRRSPILDLKLAATKSVVRVERTLDKKVSEELSRTVASPLGIRSFRVFEFNETPFKIDVNVEATAQKRSVHWRLLVREGETESSLEAEARITSRPGPLYFARIALPEDLRLKRVEAPSLLDWSLSHVDGQRILSVFFSEGQTGVIPIAIEGRLSDHVPQAILDLPQLKVLDIAQQSGEFVVQADPSLDVEQVETTGLKKVLSRGVNHWLNERRQQQAVRLAWTFDSSSYQGKIRLIPRKPQISCDTISNIRMTYREIEETVLLDFTIEKAGVRNLSFLLPSSLKDSQIVAPKLRQKTITPVGTDQVRVELELQDAVLGQFRVMIQHDRALGTGIQQVPFPVVETGSTRYRYATLENAGRDELIVDEVTGFEVVQRQSPPWDYLRQHLQGGNLTLAYVTMSSGNDLKLGFHTKQRQIVQTAGASIGMAQTTLVLDPAGVYRASMSLLIDNRTESALEIELPEGSQLWAALVAGEPVKPAGQPSNQSGKRLRIPLVKTAEGDLDYSVILKYGGRLSKPKPTRALAFPFIKTTNIQIESSQVKLFLPESFSWWHFGGTATQVDSEGEFLAGYAAYRQRQMEGLAQVLRGKNLFSSARARFNLKNLSSELTNVADELGKVSKGKYRSNQVEIEQSQSLALNAIEEYEKEEARENGQVELQIDNRDRLRQSLDTQRHQLSRNEVTRLQRNFKVMQQKKPANAPGYDTKWFEQNKLSADHFKSNDVDAGLESLKKNRFSGGVGKPSKSNSEQESRARDRRAAQNVFQRPAQAQTAQSESKTVTPGVRSAVDQVQQADTGQTLKEAYADKLELNQQMLSTEGQAAQMPQMGNNVQMEGRAEPNTITTGHSRFVSGLASLDFEIPERGNVFFFTTPRGDVQITGRGVKEDSVRQSAGLLGVVLLAGFLWLAFAVARRWNPGWKSQIVAASFLFLIGLLMLLLLVFPIYALILLLASLQLAVRGWEKFGLRAHPTI